jgi:hypothetical protein
MTIFIIVLSNGSLLIDLLPIEQIITEYLYDAELFITQLINSHSTKNENGLALLMHILILQEILILC